MINYRFSLANLFVGLMLIVLTLATLRAMVPGVSAFGVALGGLSLCTLCFALLCGLFGQPALRILLLSGVFYAWGQASLFVGDVFQLNWILRSALGTLGGMFALWAWLKPTDRGLSSHIRAE